MHVTLGAARKVEGAAGRGGGATRTVVSTFGVLAGLMGIEHGIGAVLQGSTAPPGAVFQSWPDSAAMEIVAGEPALTVVPNLLVTGVLAIVVSVALGIWSVGFAHRRHGGPVLILLAALLLLVGGGFGPPLVGFVIGAAASRIGVAPSSRPAPLRRGLGRIWRSLLVAGVLGYLSLVPGTVLLHRFMAVDNGGLVYGLTAFSFAALGLALVGARTQDQWPGVVSAGQKRGSSLYRVD